MDRATNSTAPADRLFCAIELSKKSWRASSPLPSGAFSSKASFRKERPLRDNVVSALSSDTPVGCAGQVGCVAVGPHRKSALANLPSGR
jgi:hypothetical protein